MDQRSLLLSCCRLVAHIICRKHFVEGKPSEDPSGVDYVLTIVNIKKGAWKMQKQLVQEQKISEKVQAEETAQCTGITF